MSDKLSKGLTTNKMPSWHIEHQPGWMHFRFSYERTQCAYSIRSHEKKFLSTYQPVLLHQIHSSKIVNVDCDSDQTGDGLYSQEQQRALGVKVADCLPVYLFNSSAVCIIHCGWRGIVKGIARQAAQLMNKYGYVLGADIGPCCYNVQEDVACVFQEHYPSAIRTRSGKYFLDLKAAVRADLGVGNEIASLDLCTHCSPQYFYSYRRGDSAMRNYAAIIRVE